MTITHRDMGDGFTHTDSESCGCRPTVPVPVRLQLRRTPGFSIQDLSVQRNGLRVVNATRPGFWGNWICVGDPGRLWIDVRSPRHLRTRLEVTLPYLVDQSRAYNAHKKWLTTNASTAGSLGLAWMIPGFERLEQKVQGLIEHCLSLKQKQTIALIPSLAGKNLACTCDPTAPCHADTLLSLANANQHTDECPWPGITQDSEYDT